MIGLKTGRTAAAAEQPAPVRGKEEVDTELSAVLGRTLRL